MQEEEEEEQEEENHCFSAKNKHKIASLHLNKKISMTSEKAKCMLPIDFEISYFQSRHAQFIFQQKPIFKSPRKSALSQGLPRIIALDNKLATYIHQEHWSSYS